MLVLLLNLSNPALSVPWQHWKVQREKVPECNIELKNIFKTKKSRQKSINEIVRIWNKSYCSRLFGFVVNASGSIKLSWSHMAPAELSLEFKHCLHPEHWAQIRHSPTTSDTFAWLPQGESCRSAQSNGKRESSSPTGRELLGADFTCSPVTMSALYLSPLLDSITHHLLVQTISSSGR